MKILKTIGFWLIQCTWGFIMTFIGAITALALILAGKKPQHMGPIIYIETGHNWGGINLGGFFFCDAEVKLDTKFHEVGHAVQNMIFGPLFPFLIGFPSLIRYWLRTFDCRLKKSLFNLFYLFAALILTTGLACITGPLLPGLKTLTIVIEIIRLYFLIVSIWLSAIEIKKYDKGYVEYDAIWFERQATKIGNKILNK